MAYQKKHKCYRCDGKGKGVNSEYATVFGNDLRPYMDEYQCYRCEGRGYNEYDFRPQKYNGTFKDADWGNLDIDYEDFAAKYVCECGGEMFFSESNQIVCNCGRVYKLSINLSVDEAHLNDMKYWEEYNDKTI